MATPELLKSVKETMEQRVGLYGYTSEDHVAWMVGTALGAYLKAGKYHNGDVYRQIVKQVKGIYRAKKSQNNLSGKAAYDAWYDIGPAVLQKVRDALAVVLDTTTAQPLPSTSRRRS